MELFKNIRLKIGRSKLTKMIVGSKRNVVYTDLNLVRTIGIVWDATRVSDFSGLSSFHHRMHERGIEVSILGYYPGKELPDQYTAIRYLICLRRNELDFVFHPASPEADAFKKRKFDILIDINFNNVFPLQCISALSKASFKVGLIDTGPNFDLMMDMKAPQDVGNYLHHVVHYLEMINSGEEKK